MERTQVIENIRQVAASVLPKGSFKVNLPEMKRSSILEERRKQVNPEIRAAVDLSFQIVDRIHEILTEKGLKQKDLAMLLGKEEAEISKWMRGTHNFTIDTLVSIERALQAPILQVIHYTQGRSGSMAQ